MDMGGLFKGGEQLKKIEKINKVENMEVQRPSRVELPDVKIANNEGQLREGIKRWNDSERPLEGELPYIKAEARALDKVDVNTKNCIENQDGNYDVSDNREAMKNCPIENGIWEGERGNSKWVPDSDYIPQKQNPENKTWGDVQDKYNFDGINFKDGEPDFSEISKGTVEIKDFSTSRDDNFDKADIELAKQKGCSPEDVAKWRKENRYTWHECKDMKTMQKVPSIVHNNISHRGGISEAKGGSN